MSQKILIVDDSESIRQAVGITLEKAGYTVQSAIDGLNALDYLKGEPLSLIITDLNMPNLDGIELVKKIRADENYKFTPILILTTESQAEKRNEAKSAGATGWIVKPFFPDKLIEVVKKVIR